MKKLENAVPKNSLAKHKQKPRRKRSSLEHQSQRVEIHATPLDIILVDEKTGLLIERPTFSATIEKLFAASSAYLLDLPEESTKLT